MDGWPRRPLGAATTRAERARHMSDELAFAADRVEALGRRWLAQAIGASGRRARESWRNATICLERAQVWRMAAAQLGELAATAAEEDRS